MHTSKILSMVGLVGALAVSGYGNQVTAQGTLQIGGARANFGVHALRAGFMPDPRVINVVSGGNIDARGLGLGPGCVGWVTAQPDAVVRYTGTSARLRFFVTAPGDTTLLVNTANGRWICNDDSYGGTNPTVDIPGAGAGQYDVWIGSYQSGQQVRGQLQITELDRHP